MSKWLSALIVVAVAFAGGVLWGQPKNTQPPPQIISGADFGFRVDSVAPDGTPNGKIVVRQKGEWVEVALAGGVRRLNVK